MSWDFSTDGDFQKKLDWADRLVREHIEELDLRYPGLHYTPPSGEIREIIDPMKAEVRSHGLWATHLRPELGGHGYGIEQFRLLVLHAAWTIDGQGLAAARKQIAAVKIAAPQVLHDVVMRAIQAHGALGISNELPLWRFLQQVFIVGFSDGPSEVHRISLARALLKDVFPSGGVWPREHIPTRLGLVPDDIRESIERHVGNL